VVHALRDLPIVQGQAFDPFMHEPGDAQIEGGDENDAQRFLAVANQWLRAHEVTHYRLRIIGLHRSGIATGMILGLTKQRLPPTLDPWYARVFAPQDVTPLQPTGGVFLLCNHDQGKRYAATPGVQIVAAARYAVLLWSNDESIGDQPGSGDRL